MITAKIIGSCVTWVREKVLLFCFFFPALLCCLKSSCFLLFLRFVFLLYAIIGLSVNTSFSLGLICNKCQCLSMIFLNFSKVLLNFSASGILLNDLDYGEVGPKNSSDMLVSDILSLVTCSSLCFCWFLGLKTRSWIVSI